jgi:hypothetical protein
VGHRFRQHQYGRAAAKRATTGARSWWGASAPAGVLVFALDVTTPIAPPAVSTTTEATTAGKVLWEFTDAKHRGEHRGSSR